MDLGAGVLIRAEYNLSRVGFADVIFNRVLAHEGDVLSCGDKKGRKETLPGARDIFIHASGGNSAWPNRPSLDLC